MVTMRTVDDRSAGGGASPKRSQSTVGFQRQDSRKNRIHAGQGPNQGMTMQMLGRAVAKGAASALGTIASCSGRGIIMRHWPVLGKTARLITGQPVPSTPILIIKH